MSSYPTSVPSFTNKSDNVDDVLAAHMNAVQDEITAIATGLLNGVQHHVKPQVTGTYDLGSSSLRFRNLYLSSTTPSIFAEESDQGTDAKKWRFVCDGGVFQIQTLNDGDQFVGTPFSVNRSGDATIGGSATVQGNATITGTVQIQGGNVNISNVASLDTSRTALIRALSFTSLITPSQITANQNNYNPPSGSTSFAWLLSSDAARTITGITAYEAGRLILLINAGSNNIVLANENAGSSAINRFACPGTVDFTLNPGDSVFIWYDDANDRWRVLGF